MAENDPKTADAAKPSRRNRTAKKAASSSGSNETTAIKSEKVRGQYASGVGFEAGNVAPSTKWLDENGKVVDKEPTGVSRVLVFEGDVVREHMVDAIKASKGA